MTPTTCDFDKEYRRLIEHETKLVDGRMTWFILFQTLLFVGLKELYDKPFPILVVISLIGIGISIIIRHSFWKNEKAIAFILDQWNKHLNELGCAHEFFPPIYAGYTINVHKGKIDAIWKFLLHHIAIPWLFVCACIAILLIKFYEYNGNTFIFWH